MMQGHKMMKTTPPPTTTPKPQENEQSFGDQGEASAKIENVYRLPPPKGFVYVNSVEEEYQSGQPLYRYPQTQNSIPVERYQKGSTQYLKYPATTLTPPPPPTTTRRYQEGYVVRVYPDGTPVKDTQNVLPQDEDLRQFLLSKVKLPDV